MVSGEKSALGGLSNAHIYTTDGHLKGVHFHPASVELWQGASKLRVKRAGVKTPQVGGGVRGTISDYSHNSERRLRYTVAELEREACYYFFTLTYPSEFPTESKVYKKHLNRFEQELKRKYGRIGGIWVQEFQTRGAVHFCGLLDVTYLTATIGQVREFVANAWYRIVGSNDPKHLEAGTGVEVPRNFQHTCRYMAKELSKENQKDAENVGRWWGVFGREFVHFAESIKAQVSDEQACTIIRYIRRAARLKYARAYKSLTLLCDADFWLSKRQMLLYPDKAPLHERGASRCKSVFT